MAAYESQKQITNVSPNIPTIFKPSSNVAAYCCHCIKNSADYILLNKNLHFLTAQSSSCFLTTKGEGQIDLYSDPDLPLHVFVVIGNITQCAKREKENNF